jgi:hypothetical protein
LKKKKQKKKKKKKKKKEQTLSLEVNDIIQDEKRN